MTSTTTNEHGQLAQESAISAFMDGEVSLSECQRLTEAEGGHMTQLQTWASYHVIGQAMRGQPCHGAVGSSEFVSRWRDALAKDEHVATLAQASRVGVASVASVGARRLGAANHPMWRWAAGFAVMGVAAVVAWTHLHEGPPTASQTALSAGFAPRLGNLMIFRDPQLDALLAQHRQMGSLSALQMPVVFLRNATYEQNTSR